MNSIDKTNYQRKLFPYAYNILGSSDDALDVIQDVMVKYMTGEKKDLENETGYLVKSVVNQSINLKKRHKRIGQPASWLPDPVSTDEADSDLKKREIISYSLLVLLEYLDPRERAVFILKEAFDYAHEEIAETLSITVEHSRKLLSRGKANLKPGKKEFKAAPVTSSVFLEEYIRHIKNGDIKALEGILSKEISLQADGGKKMKVVAEFTEGISPVIDLVLYLYRKYQYQYTIKIHTFNHQPALLFYHDNQLVNCQVFEIEEGNSKISSVFSVVDPDKLKRMSLPD